MGIKTKRQRRAELVMKHEHIFKCPVCGQGLRVYELKQLSCRNGHSFDFAKQGYLNLLTKLVKTKYTKELFQSRKQLMSDEGFFRPVIEKVFDLICHYFPGNNLSLLDMGCGDGSHLVALNQLLKGINKQNISAYGIDLAKEGIQEAAKFEEDVIWTVGDLANAPFSDASFDAVLNILSPSSYGEFHRIMKNNGMVIKVVPGEDYLKELRQALFTETAKQSYTNMETVQLFSDHFDVTDRIPVSYSVSLDRQAANKLINMTPMAWGTSADIVNTFLIKEPVHITVDVEILAGRKKN